MEGYTEESKQRDGFHSNFTGKRNFLLPIEETCLEALACANVLVVEAVGV